MQGSVHIWERAEAEARISEVFQLAKDGVPQFVRDGEGLFEVTFKTKRKGAAGTFLSAGGPKER